MKKISILLLFIAYSFICMGQKKIALSSTVNLSPPPQLSTLDKDNFLSSGSNKFAHSKVALDNIKDISDRTNNKHFYQIGDVFITLVHGSRNLEGKDNYLAATKKGYDAMNQKFKSFDDYSSIIKTVNKNHVLIIYHEIENVGYYNFYCNDSSNTLALNGTLQFDIIDKDRATKILDELINGVEFTR